MNSTDGKEQTESIVVSVLQSEVEQYAAEVASLRSRLAEVEKERDAYKNTAEHYTTRTDEAESALAKIAEYAPEMEGEEWHPVKAYCRLKEIAGAALERDKGMREEREKLKLTETQMRVLRRMADSLGPWSGVKALKGLCRNGLVRLVDDVHPLGPFYVITAAGKALVCAGRDPVEPQSEPLLHSKVGALQENQGQ